MDFVGFNRFCIQNSDDYNGLEKYVGVTLNGYIERPGNIYSKENYVGTTTGTDGELVDTNENKLLLSCRRYYHVVGPKRLIVVY